MDYLKVNKIFMTAIGHWPYHNPRINRLIRIFGIISVICLFIPVITALYQARKYFDDFLVCIPLNVTIVLFYVSYAFLIIKSPTILFLLNRISQDFKELDPFVTEISILRKSAEKGKFAVLSYMIYISTSYVLFCSVAFLPQILDIISPLNETRPKVYVAEVEYIFFEKDDYYYYIFLKTSIVGTFVIFTITTCDIMLYSFVQHACGMYRVLRYRLQSITKVTNLDNRKFCIGKNEDEMYRNAAACVLMHMNILKYTETLDSCFSTFLFFSHGCVIMLMTFQGAMIVTKLDKLEFVTRYSSFYFGQAIHLFYNSMPGQMLVDQSYNIIDYLYAANWQLMPPRIRKVLMLMMVRSLKESKVTIGKFFTLSMETTGLVFKTIFSYLSILISMRK